MKLNNIYTKALFFLSVASIATTLYFTLSSSKIEANTTSTLSKKMAPFTIMLNPMGDAQHPGRIIDDSFERGITLQYAQRLKQELEDKYTSKQVRIILTHLPGEAVEPLQNAAFANRLNVDLYIAISFYSLSKAIPELWAYRYSTSPTLDKLYSDYSLKSLKLTPYNQAYKYSVSTTQTYSKLLEKSMKPYSQEFDFNYKGLYSLPIKPLAGIIAPSFLFELSLSQSTDYIKWIKPMIETLSIFYESKI